MRLSAGPDFAREAFQKARTDLARGLLVDVVGKNSKFVAANPRNEVARPRCRLEAVGNDFQDLIGDAVRDNELTRLSGCYSAAVDAALAEIS